MKFKSKKLINRIVSISLAAAMLVGAGSTAVGSYMGTNGISVSAVEVYGDFEYSVNDDDTVTVTGYTGSGGDITIPSEIDGKSVTSIGSFAFQSEKLTSVTISEGITTIYRHAFSFCHDLKKVTLPNSMKSIGDCAFHGCTGLTSIEIPDSVTKIGWYAFYDTSWYNNQTDGLVYAGKIAYQYKGEMPENTSIKLKDDTVCVADSAFRGCTGLTSIVIPDSVTSIGDGAFSGCTGLTSIVIPDNVTSIGDYTFSGCTGLTSIAIPDSVTKIGGSAFSYCAGLTSIVIPDSVTSIGDYAFDGCKSLTSINIPNGVTSIRGYAFSGCTGLTSIVIPDSVTSIGWHAFSGCTGLTSINIPNGVTSIGSSAFSGCTGLTNIKIPDSVTSIGDYVFESTPWYSNQPDGVVYAGKIAYRYKGEMPENTSIKLKDGTVSVADYAFSGCAGLTSINIPNGVTSIGDCTFDGCAGLTSINIPNGVTSIGGWAFRNCIGLTSITIPNSMTSIGVAAFYHTGFTSITIPESVTSLGVSAFGGCTNLTSITVNKNNSNYSSQNGVLFNKDQTILIQYPAGKQGNYIIPESVTSIGKEAFVKCTSLTSITIPNTVGFIDNWTFYACTSLKSVTIPDGVTSIGLSAFEDCTGLTSIVIPDSVRDIGEGIGLAFKNCTNLTIYGKKGSYAEEYARKYKIPFVEMVKDNKTQITVTGLADSDVTLKVNELSVEGINIDAKNIQACFDISLVKGDSEVQPEMPVTVKIPYSSNFKNVEVYRINDDDTKDKMASSYDGEYITFVTNHLSKYAIVTDARIIGDTNGDSKVTIADSLMIARYEVKLRTLTDEQLAVSDVNYDGKVTIADALKIARYEVKLISSLER